MTAAAMKVPTRQTAVFTLDLGQRFLFAIFRSSWCICASLASGRSSTGVAIGGLLFPLMLPLSDGGAPMDSFSMNPMDWHSTPSLLLAALRVTP